MPILMAVLLVACSPLTPAENDAPTTPPAEEPTVEAAIGDIVPVVTFDAVVMSPTVFQVTAWADGRLTTEAKQLAIQPEDGDLITISFDERYQDLTPFLDDGATVARGQPIASISFGGLVLRAAVAPADELRFLEHPVSARAELTGASGPFDCRLLDPVPSLESGSAFIACAIPADVRAIAGLSGVLAVRFASVEAVVTLPLSAVSGGQDRGEVLKKTADGFVVTPVELGASDGSRIEIVSGLTAGDVVRVPGPGLLDG